jgi:hypothetical protein
MPNRHDVNPRSVADSQDLIGLATFVVAVVILVILIICVFTH